jgi:hypothetical protein
MAADEHPSDGWAVLPFETEHAIAAWLEIHHADDDGYYAPRYQRRKPRSTLLGAQ